MYSVELIFLYHGIGERILERAYLWKIYTHMRRLV